MLPASNRRKERPSLETALTGAGVLLSLILIILVTSNDALLFKSMPFNGAFQLFNPLKRLAGGQLPGRDFDFFHGTGTLLIHYPLFAIFGSDLRASEIARSLMSLLAFFGCYRLYAAAWKIPAWMSWFAACTVAVLVHAAIDSSGAYSGSSMVGLRSTPPVLILPVALFLARRFPFFSRAVVFHSVIGIGLGLALFIATEQGLAAILIHCALLLLLPVIARSFISRALGSIHAGCVAAAVYLICLLMATGGHVAEALRFAFIDLPGDQFWYFGAPPNPVPALPAIIWNGKAIIGVWFPLILISLECVRIRSAKRRLSEIGVDSCLVFVLLGLGLIAQIPQLAAYSHYQDIAVRNMGLVAMLWAFRWAGEHDFKGMPILERVRALRVPWAALALVFSFLSALALAGGWSMKKKRDRQASGVRYGNVELSKGWATELATWNALTFQGARAAGTYRTLVEDLSGSTFGGPDYIIHALGSRRPRFLANVRKFDPDFFLTINPEFSKYEEWLQLRHWDVYEYLIENHAPVRASEFHVFWKKTGSPHPQGTIAENTIEALPREGSWFSPGNTGGDAIYRVCVRYSVSNPIGRIPVAGNLTRYLLQREVVAGDKVISHVPASLPPGKTEWIFPIILKHGEQAKFTLDLKMAFPGCGCTIQSIRMLPVSRDPGVIAALTGPFPLDQVQASPPAPAPNSQ